MLKRSMFQKPGVRHARATWTVGDLPARQIQGQEITDGAPALRLEIEDALEAFGTTGPRKKAARAVRRVVLFGCKWKAAMRKFRASERLMVEARAYLRELFS